MNQVRGTRDLRAAHSPSSRFPALEKSRFLRTICLCAEGSVVHLSRSMGLETRTFEKIPTSPEEESKASEAEPEATDGSVSW